MTDQDIIKIARQEIDLGFAYVPNESIVALVKRFAAHQPQPKQEPVAYLYTLEHGQTVANTLVSLQQRNYPFGVCGADYLAKNDDGVSYVRQIPLYTAPQPQREWWVGLEYAEIVEAALKAGIPVGPAQMAYHIIEAKLREKNGI